MVPLPICLGALRLAKKRIGNRGTRSAQSGEECGVAARAKSRKRWRRRREGENEEEEVKVEEEENEEEADDEELRRKLRRN